MNSNEDYNTRQLKTYIPKVIGWVNIIWLCLLRMYINECNIELVWSCTNEINIFGLYECNNFVSLRTEITGILLTMFNPFILNIIRKATPKFKNTLPGNCYISLNSKIISNYFWQYVCLNI